MKKTFAFFTAALLAGGVCASAQSKLNPMGVMMLREYASQQHVLSGDAGVPQCAAFVVLHDSNGVRALTDGGFDVVSDLGTVVTVNVPLDRVEELSQLPQVKYVELGNMQSTDMKFARIAGNVNEAQTGFTWQGATHSYDGAGVIAGLMDMGMDANHVNFNNDANETRVERLWWFNSSNGTSRDYTASNISSFATDNSAQSHATHVAGIMAGSYKGQATVAQLSSAASGNNISVGAAAMPYYGVATGASLAFSVGNLYDANIINGVTRIVEYAESQGKPCVVNMSLGSNSGPHDGSSAYSRSLAELGKRAIICMSAGNEGDEPLFVTKEFASASDDLKTMITPADITNRSVSGIVDVWGKTDRILSVSWALYNTANRTLTTLGTVSRAGASLTINSGTFSTAFSGAIEMASEVNPLNNRYHVQCRLGSVGRKTAASTSCLALVVKAVGGEQVYVYGTENITFTSNSLAGWTGGSTDGTINDGACAANVISVGSANSTKYSPRLNRQVYVYDVGDAGEISSFSSYGTTFQGVPKPDLAAPGAVINSSYSRYYVSSGSISTSGLAASAVRAGVTNYWGPMTGTSMSCPFVSGTVALWLQANPSLKYEDVMKVIANSSTFNEFTMGFDAERWGAGMVNAVEGLKYILTNTGIDSVNADDPSKCVVIQPVAGGYEITVAGSAGVRASLFNLSGIEVAATRSAASTAVLATSGVQSGIHVLCVDTPAGRYTAKVAVR